MSTMSTMQRILPMNDKNTPSETPEASINDNHPTRTRAARRIDATTISEIARLCARQLSEAEACRKLGIKPQQWFSWKARHNPQRGEARKRYQRNFWAGRDDLPVGCENGIRSRWREHEAAGLAGRSRVAQIC